MQKPARLLTVAALACLAACGDNTTGSSGPYDDVDKTLDLNLPGLEGNVHVVRDRYGIAHISAESINDIGIAQGYIMAHDRIAQMDTLRRFGAGTLAELFGALDASIVESDMEMRVHRLGPIAAEAYAELQSSSDPFDQRLVALLDGFSIGVNAFVSDLRDGDFTLDPEVSFSFDPMRFEEWTPVDSLILGRFQAHSLSFSANDEVTFTAIYDAALAEFDESPAMGQPGFDPERDRRRGAAADLTRLIPAAKVATRDGFPNIDADSGTRSDGPGSRMAPATVRPRIPRELLDQARRFFAPKIDGFGPHSFRRPSSGSNNWVVGPQHTGGKLLLAGDQHLPLPNPSIFYPTHLVIPGELDVEGVTFPGIPGVILGHNGEVAWTSTVVAHDANDVYLENIAPCAAGGGDCVAFDGGEVAIETWDETIEIGALGTITESIVVTYENVPHHGYIIPQIANREIVTRTANQALSVRYTGQLVTQEVRAVFGLAVARDLDEAFTALGDFGFGGQNWAIITSGGDFGWSTHALVPRREVGAFGWDPVTAPRGNAPWMVLPGDGSAEWDGFIDSRYIPHAINPESGYIATANSDPVGSTFEGNPLAGPVVDGRPLYIGALYASGLRTARIDERVNEAIAAGEVTLDDLAEIQHDSHSTVGERARGDLLVALAHLDGAGPPADVTTFLAGVSPQRLAEMVAARDRLAAWSRQTPPAIETRGADEVRDSAATTLFNVWMHYFLAESVGDELAAIGENVHGLQTDFSVRIALALLSDPGSLASGIAVETGEPILCDTLGTPAIESCSGATIRALDAALTFLASAEGFGSSQPDDWTWGALHTLTLEPLFPNNALNVPNRDDRAEWQAGFPAPGDQFVVNAANGGYNSTNFTFSSGPAQRFLAEVEPGETIRSRFALPGGVIFNRESTHYRDLFDDYYSQRRHLELPFSTEEVVRDGEERWLLAP